jgi:hypothetical protein
MTDHAEDPYATSTIPYADLPATRGTRAWAGAAILLGGCALVALGGCFLIGVLAIVSPQVFAGNNNFAPANTHPALTGPEVSLMVFLYILAFACFAGAAVVLLAGVRGLLRLLRA